MLFVRVTRDIASEKEMTRREGWFSRTSVLGGQNQDRELKGVRAGVCVTEPSNTKSG